ncbi:MAG: hypothetical protein Ct9H300mP6_17690 [Gammaproteobacteria bacterium]|nr:MAG: hypothetical protein Ct9H300mP6_17690 [Gammaproteobacteria bacterium]
MGGDLATVFDFFWCLSAKSSAKTIFFPLGLTRKGINSFDLKKPMNLDQKKNFGPQKPTSQLNEIWRKRTKNDLLSLVLAGKKP